MNKSEKPQRIILLDLNVTLVSNTSQAHELPYTYNVDKEYYRQWLIDMLRDEYVIMMTSRPERHKQETLQRIKRLHGWNPQEALFNSYRKPAPVAKSIMLRTVVFKRHGIPKDQIYLALESNRASRTMFKNQKIRAIRQEDLKKLGSLDKVAPIRDLFDG